MGQIFIDTGFLIALETSDDQHHESAQNCWRNLLVSKPSFFTTSYIIDEVATFFNSRNRHSKAVETVECLLNSPSVSLIHVDEALFCEGWRYFKQHDDKSYSLTDCISFIVMSRFEIQKALTFDRHFEQAGFRKLPE
jgi:predicted nucleic acid-binding protein